MDDRAIHLQSKAHYTVAKALHDGTLTRKPCEICGEDGQAHHDSYYPDKWLDVRWLCGSHHKQWHDRNEPIWPTIYEFHPSDAKQSFSELSEQATKLAKLARPGGRTPKPWYRKGKKAWYVWHDGRQVLLGKEYDRAVRAFEQLMTDELRRR